MILLFSLRQYTIILWWNGSNGFQPSTSSGPRNQYWYAPDSRPWSVFKVKYPKSKLVKLDVKRSESQQKKDVIPDNNFPRMLFRIHPDWDWAWARCQSCSPGQSLGELFQNFEAGTGPGKWSENMKMTTKLGHLNLKCGFH